MCRAFFDSLQEMIWRFWYPLISWMSLFQTMRVEDHCQNHRRSSRCCHQRLVLKKSSIRSCCLHRSILPLLVFLAAHRDQKGWAYRKFVAYNRKIRR